MNSQIHTHKKKWWNFGITNTLIPTFFQKKVSHEGTKTFLGQIIMTRLF